MPIVGDTVCEPDETFTVTLSSPNGAIITTATGTGTIINDDSYNADVSITKTAPAGPFFAGQNLSYTIAVNNAGPATANSVVVTDTLPSGSTFVSASPSQGSCSGTTTVTCTLGSIVNGGTATIVLTVSLSAGGPLSNTAAVSDALRWIRTTRQLHPSRSNPRLRFRP